MNTSSNTMDNIEESKENVRPLRRGRKINALAKAKAKMEVRRTAFQEQKKEMSDVELLNAYHDYILWIEQNYAFADETVLKTVQEECLDEFFKSTNKHLFTSDKKLLSIFLKHTSMRINWPESFKTAYAAGFFKTLAPFYIEWSYHYEVANDMNHALKVLNGGKTKKAQPAEQIVEAIDKLNERTYKNYKNDPSAVLSGDHRQALKQLKSRIGGLAPVDRVTNAILPPIRNRGLRPQGTAQAVGPSTSGQQAVRQSIKPGKWNENALSSAAKTANLNEGFMVLNEVAKPKKPLPEDKKKPEVDYSVFSCGKIAPQVVGKPEMVKESTGDFILRVMDAPKWDFDIRTEIATRFGANSPLIGLFMKDVTFYTDCSVSAYPYIVLRSVDKLTFRKLPLISAWFIEKLVTLIEQLHGIGIVAGTGTFNPKNMFVKFDDDFIVLTSEPQFEFINLSSAIDLNILPSSSIPQYQKIDWDSLLDIAYWMLVGDNHSSHDTKTKLDALSRITSEPYCEHCEYFEYCEYHYLQSLGKLLVEMFEHIFSAKSDSELDLSPFKDNLRDFSASAAEALDNEIKSFFGPFTLKH